MPFEYVRSSIIFFPVITDTLRKNSGIWTVLWIYGSPKMQPEKNVRTFFNIMLVKKKKDPHIAYVINTREKT